LVGSGRYLSEVLNGNRPEGLRKAVKRPHTRRCSGRDSKQADAE